MTSTPRSGHVGGLKGALARPARPSRASSKGVELEALQDVLSSASGEPLLLELCSKACAVTTSLLPAVRWASVTTAFDARPVTVAVTELRALLLDHTQYREKEGPALQAVRTGERVWAIARPGRPRWRGLRVVADVLGVKWVMALPLRAGGAWVGSLNLYGTEPVEDSTALNPHVLTALVEYLEKGLEGYLAGDGEVASPE